MHSRELRQVLVSDQVHPCSYLPGRLARLPLRMAFDLTPAQFDDLLAQGDRRTGAFLYRTQCPACQACQPIRLRVQEFEPRTTQRRTLRRGDALLSVTIGPPQVDRQRIDLYNLHRRLRGLDRGDGEIGESDYRDFLVETCCQTLELRYAEGDSLKAVAIADLGEKSLSAVYCYFDPRYRAVSLGTYSVLKQVELCRAWGLDYLYLGLYIAESPHMNYKANFLPHERLIHGVWSRFDS
jgi:arginine-tRNA-protein transferase